MTDFEATQYAVTTDEEKINILRLVAAVKLHMKAQYEESNDENPAQVLVAWSNVVAETRGKINEIIPRLSHITVPF